MSKIRENAYRSDLYSLLYFVVISDLYRSFIPNKTSPVSGNTQWISTWELWNPMNKVAFGRVNFTLGLLSIVNTTVSYFFNTANMTQPRTSSQGLIVYLHYWSWINGRDVATRGAFSQWDIRANISAPYLFGVVTFVLFAVATQINMATFCLRAAWRHADNEDGWGPIIFKPIPSIPLFSPFSEQWKHWSPVEYLLNIWQASPSNVIQRIEVIFLKI